MENIVQENTHTYYWSGTITTTAGKVYDFDYKNIVKGSGYGQQSEHTEHNVFNRNATDKKPQSSRRR